jgi:hypothetical protein
MSRTCWTVLSCALGFFSASVSFAGKIEADPNKDYTLTKQRGPWMILVTTFHQTGEADTPLEGKTPEQAAKELVLELRQLGLPAYVHVHQTGDIRVTTTDRIGRSETRKILHRRTSVAVLAGNYGAIDDTVAQDSLKWVKKLNPKCLQEGVVYAPTPGRPGPLAGAFLVPNPLLSDEELATRERDPLLVQLNSGERYSLYECGGKYTLLVARFYGKQVTLKAGEKEPGILDFLKDNDLDNAALGARELVTVLRGKYDVSPAGNFNNVEAYIWHDRHESVVTVGSFDSPQDPRIQKYLAVFGPQFNPQTGTTETAHFAVANFRKGGAHAMWLFEPNPQILPVPQK